MEKEPDNYTIKEKNIRNLKTIINKAKELYDKKHIVSNLNNPKSLWNVINQKIGRNSKENQNINYRINADNNKITESNNIANYMNKFFSNIDKELSKKIKHTSNEALKLPTIIKDSIFFHPTDEWKIVNIINKMQIKKGGINNLSTKTLKVLVKYLALPIPHIINLRIDKAIRPYALKKAEIIPIHKSKDKHNATNYRPISLISNLAKIFEKIIHNRITNFINKFDLLAKNQYGFRKNKSTKDALVKVTNTIYKNFDKSTPIAITFLDLAKAFDTVDHQILLDKLYNYGIRGISHKLITNYLQNRQQKVMINDTTSQFAIVNTGIPQVTILRPLLFLLYINDMLLEMPDDTIISYADDTAVLATAKNWDEVENKMNVALYRISKWLTLNKQSLDTDKTIYMEFGNQINSIPRNLNIHIQGTKIKRIESYKYLGIIFDSNMKWNALIDHIYNKTKYLIFIFRKLNKLMSIETLRMVYYALFHSSISYGIIAWGGAYSNSLNLLKKLQNRILKIINNNKFIEKCPLNIDQIFSCEALSYHYEELRTLFTNSNSSTRNKNLQIPRRNLTTSIKN